MKLVVDKASLVSVADAIRTKGNTTDELQFPNGFVDGINAIESGGGGGTEEIEHIIDASGVLDSTDGSVEEKVEMLTHYVDVFKKVYKLSYYGIKTLEHIDFYIDFVGCELDFQYSSVKTMVGVDVSKLNTCRNLFGYCQNLVSIQRPFDMSKFTAWSMSGVFFSCTNLVDVRFVEKTIKESISFAQSSLLSTESIISILQGLAPVETTQTLTVNGNVYNKMYENELYPYLDEALEKGWDITV